MWYNYNNNKFNNKKSMDDIRFSSKDPSLELFSDLNEINIENSSKKSKFIQKIQ